MFELTLQLLAELALAITIVALATDRVTRLIVEDKIFEGIRDWILVRFPPSIQIRGMADYTKYQRRPRSVRRQMLREGATRFDATWVYQTAMNRHTSMLGDLLVCRDCVSVWVAAPLTLILVPSDAPILIGVVMFFASASLARLLLHRR